ncbi:MAG TPA: hypothetical protein VFV54_07075 [Thermoanaerobaculia bacterium]|nr:hypothetical protein [Thermoanaerobaculia bacterium]
MKSGFKWAITLLGFLLLLALPLAAQEPPTDTTATTDTSLMTDTTVTTETTITETSTTEVEPTDTASTTTYYEEDMDDDDVMDDEEGAKVCAACAAFGIALPLILLGISIAIALWIYRDAKTRGITSAPLWAILGFLFNILGLVIYLIARKGMTPPPGSATGSMAPPPPTPPPHV